jgi:hypothetical protein
VEYAIYGNGKDGLNVRVDRLEQARLSDKERWALFYGPWLSGLIVAAAAAVIQWIVH